MKLISISLIVVSGLGGFCFNGLLQDSKKDSNMTQYVFQFDELESNRAKSKRPYLSFLNNSTMHCGVYTLKAGAKDGQQPHKEDEIYYVQEGEAKIRIHDKDYDLKPGSVVFVPAYAPHKFHSIAKDLKTLVFFSKVPVKKKTEEKKKQ